MTYHSYPTLGTFLFHLLPTTTVTTRHSSKPLPPPPPQPSIVRKYVSSSSFESRSSGRQGYCSSRAQFLEARRPARSRALRMSPFRVALMFLSTISPLPLTNSGSSMLTRMQMLLAVTAGAFGVAGYYFGNTPDHRPYHRNVN